MNIKSICMKVLIAATMLLMGGLLLFVVQAGCDKESTNPEKETAGVITGHSDCGGYPTAKRFAPVPTNQSSVYYSYDGQGKLDLHHMNAGFNCCPIIVCVITIDGNTITVQEKETFDELGGCHCLCLFDVDYEINGLSPGEYNIKFIELYTIESDEKLEFTITLEDSGTTGSYTVNRNHYPWSEEIPPSGSLKAHSGCGGFDSFMFAEFAPEDSNCIIFDYDNTNTLNLRHQNAMFNCCPDSLYADIDLTDNIIFITEYESLSMPCDCVCDFDLDFIISNLVPGEYVLKVITPYYKHYENNQVIQDTMVVNLDLINNPSGYECFCGIVGM